MDRMGDKMERWMIIAIFFLLVVGVYVYMEYRRRQNRKRLLEKIRASWGEVPEREYTLDEFGKISHYFRKSMDESFSIDDITWNDLEMDDVFMCMNHTYSSLGEEYLYKMLRKPVFDEKVLAEREKLISYFQNPQNREKREKIQVDYAGIGRTNMIAMADYLYNFVGLETDGNAKHYIQILVLLASFVGIFFYPQLFVLIFIFAMGWSIKTYYDDKKLVENYFSCIQYLLLMTKFGADIAKLEIEELKPYAEVIAQVCRKLKPMNKKAFWINASGSGSMVDLFMDYFRLVFHVDLIAFNSLVKYAKEYLHDIENLIDQLGIVESCIAVASFRESMSYYAVPKLLHGKGAHFHADNLYHPMIEEPVANSIHEDRSVLVTGSNASGKSTFLKTVALNAVLAQTVNTVLAESYEANYYRVFSSMALRDDLQGQESYYIVEIKSLKRILDSINEEAPILCFVDEVLRGTNTVERISASSHILQNLSSRNVMCFAATHDIELTHMLEQIYSNYHFSEEIMDDDILFNYVLYKGRATTRNAIKLLGIMGYSEEIISQAEQTAARFLKEGTWTL